MPDLSHLSYKTYDNVYEPSHDSYLLMDALFNETEFFQQHFSPTTTTTSNPSLPPPPLTCLEIGPGTAVATVTLYNTLHRANLPSHHLMIDINPIAVETARQTCLANGVSSFDVLQGDLVAPLQTSHDTIDILLFNPPYVPTPSEEVGGISISAAWAGGGQGKRSLGPFVARVGRRAEPKRRVLFDCRG